MDATSMILVAMAIIVIVAFWYTQSRPRCVYSGTSDTYMVYRENLCKCEFPKKYPRRVRATQPDECIALNADGTLTSCTPDAKCANVRVYQSGDDINICRGPNVLPHKISSQQYGIRIDERGVAVPIAACDSLLRNGRLFYTSPVCVDGVLRNGASLIAAKSLKMLDSIES